MRLMVVSEDFIFNLFSVFFFLILQRNQLTAMASIFAAKRNIYPKLAMICASKIFFHLTFNRKALDCDTLLYINSH